MSGSSALVAHPVSDVPVSGPVAEPALPAPVPAGDWLRAWLAWPARWFDGWASTQALPVVSTAERHRRLTQTTPPEGWLALQPGLATVGDATTWTSFAARGSTALAVGGVHGPDRPAAYARFRDEAQALGLTRQAVYPVREPDVDAAQSAGFEVLPIAVEAWVDLEGFTLRGKRFADLRQMRNRAKKLGVVVEEVDPAAWRGPLEAAWRRFLGARQVPWQVRWLSGGPVFTSSWGHRTFIAHRDGDVQAFCTILPGHRGTASLDVMSRSPEAAPGSMEGLLVNVLQQLRTEGLTSVSLGPVPLAGDVPQRATGLFGTAMRWARASPWAEAWFGFGRLEAFKDKFRPRYEVVNLGLSPRASMLALYLVARIWALGD